MKIFALRHKPTGKWMPCRMFRTSRAGWSFWNPFSDSFVDEPYDDRPRIFFTRRAAEAAMGAWCAGEWKTGMTIGSPFEPAEETPARPRKVRRYRGELEIVEGELTL